MLTISLRVPLFIALVFAVPTQGLRDPLGSGLADGTRLVYASNGRQGGGSVVDSVRPVRMRDDEHCVLVFTGGSVGPPQHRMEHYCERRDTLYLRDSTDRFVAQRPIGVRMTMEFIRQNGNRVRYSTDTASRVTISGQSVAVVLTTVLTMDSTGRPLRRLTERYAPALITAVGGRFESADSTSADGWRQTQVFELREIQAPSRR